MPLLLLTVFANSHDFRERRYQILHPVQQQALTVVTLHLSLDHRQQLILRHVAVALLVPADVEGQQLGNLSKLVLARLGNQPIGVPGPLRVRA